MTLPDFVRREIEWPDDVIRAMAEVETRYIQGFTYGKDHVIRDVMRPAGAQVLWSAPVADEDNSAALLAQCEIEHMRRRLSALAPHLTALLAAAREEEREECAKVVEAEWNSWVVEADDNAQDCNQVAGAQVACRNAASAIRSRAPEGETG